MSDQTAYTVAPGFRMPFGHTHETQEEVYVVITGRAWDAPRIAPGVARGLQAGPNGAEVIAFGAPNTENKDAEMLPGWWAD